jgi:hypothetical protein
LAKRPSAAIYFDESKFTFFVNHIANNSRASAVWFNNREGFENDDDFAIFVQADEGRNLVQVWGDFCKFILCPGKPVGQGGQL